MLHNDETRRNTVRSPESGDEALPIGEQGSKHCPRHAEVMGTGTGSDGMQWKSVKCDVTGQRRCYVLGPTQGAFFIFHLLTKPFPSRDQPPIHLDHMTNHLTSHLTTHMTGHMSFQSPAPQSHLSYITCSQVTCVSPNTPSPDLT